MDTSNESLCPYAVLCRVPSSARESAPKELLQSSSNELLVAIATHQLHVFARKSDRVPPSCCPCDDTLLRKHGFLCPHVTSCDDYGHHLLTIPVSAITQISMTYRTATVASSSAATTSSSPATSTQNKTVATRTKDLVVGVCHGKLLLWLEFEHNLARGWFLEALTAGPFSTSTIDVDYVDLSDTSALEQLLHPHPPSNGRNTTTTTKDFAPQQRPEPLRFLRDAWRHIVYDKIKLALQIAHDNPTAIDCENEPIVSCLLTCAMELSTRLDEPDLDAFTWLTSGFLNMHSLSKTKQDLALSQVLHCLDLGRLNSLELLSCLALQCAGDFYLHRQCDVEKARPVLTQAARLVTISAPCSTMEPALKMQLHATLRELGSVHTLAGSPDCKPAFVQRANSTMSSVALAVSANRELFAGGALRSGSSSSLLDKHHTTKSSFSLYAHVFGSGASVSGTSRRGSSGSSSAGTSGSDPVMARLLCRVNKTLDDLNGGSGSCFVDVLGAYGVRKARFRVFYDAQSTITWLRDHIQRRFELALQSSLDEELQKPSAQEVVRVELFYDPQRKQLVPLLETAWLRDWVPQTTDSAYLLHAKLANSVVSSHRSTDRTPAMVAPPRVADQTPPSLLCSLCGQRILLEHVEDHSETCF